MPDVVSSVRLGWSRLDRRNPLRPRAGQSRTHSARANLERRLDGGLVNEKRGAGNPVEAGRMNPRQLRLFKPGPFQFASLLQLRAATSRLLSLLTQVTLQQWPNPI